MKNDETIRNNANVLKVFGEGIVEAAPDRALITLGVVTEAKNPEMAQEENAELSSNVIQALQKLGVPSEQIKTDDYRIEPQYEYIDGRQRFLGYKVTHIMEITNDRIDQTGTLVDAAVKNGANSVSGVRFVLKNTDSYYNQALSIALLQALGKATAISKTLHVSLSPIPITIQEISSISGPIPFQTATYAKNETNPIQSGELKITASIQAEYTYI